MIDFNITNGTPFEILVAMQMLSQQLAVKQQNNDQMKEDQEEEVGGPADA